MAADIRELTFQNVLDTILKPAGVKVGGFPHEIFQDLNEAEKETWICNICFLLVNDARQCDNQHLFCHTCIFAWTLTLGENSQKCPMCRTEQRQYSANKEIDRQLLDKRVQCPETGCTFKSPLKILLMHSHGRHRYSNHHVDLESLRPSRAQGAQLLLFPIIGSPGAGRRAGGLRDQLAQGRVMIHQMMLLLHLEMQLRQQALVTYTHARDPATRIQRLDEVLALNEQLNEVGTILSGMLGSPMNGPGTARGRNNTTEPNRELTPVPSRVPSRLTSPTPDNFSSRTPGQRNRGLVPVHFREGHGIGLSRDIDGDDVTNEEDEDDDSSTSSDSTTMSTMMTSWRANLRRDLDTPGGVGDFPSAQSRPRNQREPGSITSRSTSPETLDFVRPSRREHQSLFGSAYEPNASVPGSVAARRVSTPQLTIIPEPVGSPPAVSHAVVSRQTLDDSSTVLSREESSYLDTQSPRRGTTTLPRIDQTRSGIVASSIESTTSPRSTAGHSSSGRVIPMGSSAHRRTLQSVDREDGVQRDSSNSYPRRVSDVVPSSAIFTHSISNATSAANSQAHSSRGGDNSTQAVGHRSRGNSINVENATETVSATEMNTSTTSRQDELHQTSDDHDLSEEFGEARSRSGSAVRITPFPEEPQLTPEEDSRGVNSVNRQLTHSSNPTQHSTHPAAVGSYAPQRRFRRDGHGPNSRSQELPRQINRPSHSRPGGRSLTSPMPLRSSPTRASDTSPIRQHARSTSLQNGVGGSRRSDRGQSSNRGASSMPQKNTVGRRESRATVPVEAASSSRGPSTPGQLLRARRRSEILQDLMFTQRNGSE